MIIYRIKINIRMRACLTNYNELHTDCFKSFQSLKLFLSSFGIVFSNIPFVFLWPILPFILSLLETTELFWGARMKACMHLCTASCEHKVYCACQICVFVFLTCISTLLSEGNNCESLQVLPLEGNLKLRQQIQEYQFITLKLISILTAKSYCILSNVLKRHITYFVYLISYRSP